VLGRRFNRRAVSEVIAGLLLIAIAVSAAVLLYVFAIGVLGNLASSGGEQTGDQVVIEAFNFPENQPLTITFRNVGAAAVDMSHANYFLNGVVATPDGGCNLMLKVSQTCQTTLTVTTASLTSNSAYPLKVVSPDGGVYSYSVTYGSSS